MHDLHRKIEEIEVDFGDFGIAIIIAMIGRAPCPGRVIQL